MLINYKPVNTNEKYEVSWATTIGGITSDSAIGGINRVDEIVPERDGGYIVSATFMGEINIGTYNFKEDYISGLLIKYNSNNEVEWVDVVKRENTSVAKRRTRNYITSRILTYYLCGATINSITKTNDEGTLVTINYAGTVKIGNYTFTANAEKDYETKELVAKYNKNGNVEWVIEINKDVTKQDYINSVAKLNNGKYIIAGYTYNKNLSLDNGEILNVKNEAASYNGMILEIEEFISIAQKQEVTFEDNKKEFKIYTKVEGEGGSITGYTSGEEALVEKVKYQSNSTKEIIVTPQEGYSVSGITINGKDVAFTRKEDGSVTLEQFENMQEDKLFFNRYYKIANLY